MTQSKPILWSFRRCPYAMRARLGIQNAEVTVELREILLKDKPAEFLQTSPSATVPALRLSDQVLDESLDIMIWALKTNDPKQLLDMPGDGWSLITENDGPFKSALDHTKYISRYPEYDVNEERLKASVFLAKLEERLAAHRLLFGDRATIADFAILPFVRQFANIDRDWFNRQPWPNVINWLDRFLESDDFNRMMTKYTPWSAGDDPIWFGA